MLPKGSEYSKYENFFFFFNFIDKLQITHRLIKNISPLSGFLPVISRTLRSNCLQELQILLPSDFMTVLVHGHTVFTLVYA